MITRSDNQYESIAATQRPHVAQQPSRVAHRFSGGGLGRNAASDTSPQKRRGAFASSSLRRSCRGAVACSLVFLLSLFMAVDAPGQTAGAKPKTGATKTKRTSPTRTKQSPKRGAAAKKQATPAPPKVDEDVAQKLEAALAVEAKRQREEARKALVEKRRVAREGRRPTSSKPNPALQTKKPTSRPTVGASPRTEPGRGPTTQVDIAPSVDNTPPEEKTYWFGCKDCTYRQLVEGFARQTGLGVIGETPKDGKVSFVSTKALSFKEALGQVRMLLFKYKPHEPYWLERHETHLEVIRVADIYRILRPDQIYPTLAGFRAASLPPDELALVIYTPQSGSISELQIVRDFMPDYVRVTPHGNGSSIILFALVRDINKYFELAKIFVGGNGDPRTFKVIHVQYATPSDVVSKLQTLMVSDGGIAPTRSRTPSRTPRKTASAIDSMNAPGVTLLPDDLLGVIFVRAMQDKIDEIEKLLSYIDVDPSGEQLVPIVIPVEHAQVDVLIETVNQILTVSRGAAKPKSKTASRVRKTTKPGGTGGATKVGDEITLIKHPSENAIIVLASEEGVSRVRELVQQFDIKSEVGPVRLAVKHRNPSDLGPELTSYVSSSGESAPKGRVVSTKARFRLIPAPTGDALWFTGSERDLEKVKSLLLILDVADDGMTLHVRTLQRALPSFVVNFLREFDRESAKPATPAVKAVAGRRSRPVQVTKFTADDAKHRLYVFCTEPEWSKYETIIDELDAVGDDDESFVRLELHNLEADFAISRLAELFLTEQDGSLRFGASEGAVLVMGATDSQIEDIKEFLVEIDRPTEMVQKTFVMRYRDVAEMKAAIESLISDAGDDKATRRRPKTKGQPQTPPTLLPELTMVQLGRSLIVRTTPEKLKRIEEFVAEFDVEGHDTVMRVYEDFAPGTNLDSIADTLAAALSGSPTPGRAKSGKSVVRGTTANGPRFIPQTAAGRLVIIAAPVAFVQIEELLDVLRSSTKTEPFVTEFIKVVDANADTVVGLIAPLLEMSVRQLVRDGRLHDAVTPAGVKPRPTVKRANQVAVTTEHYHIDADTRNGVVIVMAPQVLVDEVRVLVERFDKPGAGGNAIHKTVALKNANPAEMVKSVEKMIGTDARAKSRRGAGKGPGADTGGEDFGALSVVEVPGAQAVFLQGPAGAVERAVAWISDIDAASVSGRTVKVYELEYADVKKIAELIMNAVDIPAAGARKPPARRRPGAEESDDSDMFELTKTWTGDTVYIQADLIAKTMIVAAPDGKIAQIDSLVAMFDTEDTAIEPEQRAPSFVYDLVHAEAFDAEFVLEGLLEQVWDDTGNIPQVSASYFGNSLVVRCIDETRFDEIREIIRDSVDKPDPADLEVKQAVHSAPKGISASELAARLLMSHPDLKISIKDMSDKTKIATTNLEELGPYVPPSSNRCVLPLSLLSLTDDLAATLTALEANDDSTSARAAIQDAKRGGKKKDPEEDMLRAFGNKMLGRSAPSKSESDSRRSALLTEGEGVTIYYDDTTGSIIVEGPAGIVNEVPDWIETIKEGIDEKSVRPDIKVVRVRYIDVYTAADILEEMFNATRQQKQQNQQAARIAAQQRVKQQQLLQRQQQAAAKAGQQGQANRPGQRGAQQPQQPAAAVAQLPPTSVRIYPNPRDHTLTLRADSSQFPAILEMLATIDRPQPIKSKLRVYPLRNRDALEVEELLKMMLGLDQKASARRGGQQRRAGAGGATAQRNAVGGELPETLMEPLADTDGVLGVGAKDVKLSSSESSNSIEVMAPKVVLDYVGTLIDQLEKEEMPERVAKYYALEHADANEVAEYLTTHYEEQAGKAGGAGKKRGASGGKDRDMPAFVAFAPQNSVTALAMEEQHAEISEIVARLDQPSEDAQWQSVPLQHSDAAAMAETLSSMYGGSTAPRRGRPRAAPSGSSGPRFVGEDGGKTLFYMAQEAERAGILASVAKLEADGADSKTVRVISLDYAVASSVADAIQEAYGGTSGQRRGGRGAAKSAPFSISAHDATKKLFVLADDGLFEKIESLAKTLDVEQGIGAEFRIYPLQHANARSVHETMTKLLTDYLRRLGGKSSEMEPFSVEADDQANALVVLGSPTVFTFLERTLAKIDVPANAAKPPVTLVTTLTYADATEVATNIMRLYGEKSLPAGTRPPHAEANRATNVLIVRGTEEQVAEIKREVIEPLEDPAMAGAQGGVPRIITLKNAIASEIAPKIEEMFASQSGASRGQTPAVIIANDLNNTLLVKARAKEFEAIKTFVGELDTDDGLAEHFRMIQIASGVNVTDLAEKIERTLNESAKSRSGGGKGRTSPSITVTPDRRSNSIILAGNPDMFDDAEEIAKKLEKMGPAGGQGTRIISVDKVPASDILALIEHLKGDSGGRRRGASRSGRSGRNNSRSGGSRRNNSRRPSRRPGG